MIFNNGKNSLHLKAKSYSLVLIVSAKESRNIVIVNKKDLSDYAKKIIKNIQGENGKEYFINKVYPTIANFAEPLSENSLSFMRAIFLHLKDSINAGEQDRIADIFLNSRFEYSKDLYFVLNSCFPDFVFNHFKHKDGFGHFRRGSANLIRSLYYSGMTAEADLLCQKLIEKAEELHPLHPNYLKLSVLSEQAISFYYLPQFALTFTHYTLFFFN